MTPIANKKVHITGGCGYIGSRTARALAEKGYTVIAVDKATPEERKADLPSTVEYRKADLTTPEAARESLADARAVIHLAANIGSLNYMWEHQAEILQDNAAIEAAVHPALASAGCQFLVYSSSSMVFQHSPRYPYVESDLAETPAARNVYGFSKLIGEYFCRAQKEQYGKPAFTIVRYHNIYGPGEDTKGSTPGDIHVIPALLEKIFRAQYPLEFIGDPEATRSFTYIDDAVSATAALFDAGYAGDSKVLNTDFNIAAPGALRILDLGRMLWERYGDGRPFKYTYTETDASRATARFREADPRKLIEAVGWRPEKSFEEGIEQTAAWVRSTIG